MNALGSGMRAGEVAGKWNLQHPIRWIPPDAQSVLDVGCNSGALLRHILDVYPEVRVAGIEIGDDELAEARRALPEVELYRCGAEEMPFQDESFDCVTCIEVLEHIREGLRRGALGHMRRVLRPGGRLVLRVPHAGLFAWLDPNNFRFRLGPLYRGLVGRGRRDAGYDGRSYGVVWHHHFRLDELKDLLGPGWEVEAVRYGALFLAPVCDALSWPFYRLRRLENPAFRALHAAADADMGLDYGPASYNILLALRKM